MTARRTAFAVLLALFLPALSLYADTYHGNTRSHVFHQSSCEHYSCKNCTATFATVADAIAAGYHACGICRPGEHAPALADVEDGYSGNTSTRKFHRATCRYAGCKNCTAKFKTRQEAIDAGYVPGGCCKP